MYKHIRLALVLGLTGLAMPATAAFIEFQQAIETDDVIVVLGNGSSGTVSVAPCENCERQIFTIDADTRVFHNDQELPLQAANSLNGKSANRAITVIYTVADRTVEKISWWTRAE